MSTSNRNDIDPALLENIKAAIAQASDRQHRCTVVFAGDRDTSRSIVSRLLAESGYYDIACYSDQVPRRQRDCFSTAAFNLLGNEIDVLVFDAWAGFDPNAFGALTGSIRAGGMLILLVPTLDAWSAYKDPQNQRIAVFPLAAGDVSGRFLQRLAETIAQDKHSLLVEQGHIKHSPLLLDAPAAGSEVAVKDKACVTLDQQRAVEAIIKVATGHRRRPLVLVSDRGRGKSAAFGIAAARLIQQGKQHIVVTAPRREAAETSLQHARQLLVASKSPSFIAPNELLKLTLPVDLVLVDEAAAIPGPLLEALLKRFNRIAFATTVHGYEGTGRGFALRFSRLLDQYTNSWKLLQMQTPIRWAPDDPLEQLVFRMLALDAEPAQADCFDNQQDASRYELQLLNRDALAANEPLLLEIFGLLVQAHYRTQPMDLRHLLDGPNLTVYVLTAGGHVAATALVASEGGFKTQVTEAIWAGRSRPHGHLLPEALSAHLGLMSAPELRAARVMRLAVHPALQRRGLGSRLVREITAGVIGQGYDYLGTSFGATPELLDFWQQLDWLPVRVSIRKGASSGSHSALLLKPLTQAGHDLQQAARQRFFAQFPDQLSDSLCALEPALVAALLRQADTFAPALDTADIDDLRAFAYANRLAEVTIGSLWRFTMSRCMQGQGIALSGITAMQRDLLIARVLQKRSWSVCAQLAGLSGRKQALQALRDTVSELL
ncbi:tRNA cytosine(34) acetyltransferase [hydrothermal vent metagenome]|uniref:tRNA cytosine(34) acetyltransferase n=1 Tax=hydrothermal vent metagenome TaxID=652676 RepID=A0A3B0YBU7_9ZZZZ